MDLSFSHSTIVRARQIHRKYFRVSSTLKAQIVYAISMLDFYRELENGIESIGCNADLYHQAALGAYCVLIANCISNDDIAAGYLAAVEPILAEWDAKVEQTLERQNAELSHLLKSFERGSRVLTVSEFE